MWYIQCNHKNGMLSLRKYKFIFLLQKYYIFNKTEIIFGLKKSWIHCVIRYYEEKQSYWQGRKNPIYEFSEYFFTYGSERKSDYKVIEDIKSETISIFWPFISPTLDFHGKIKSYFFHWLGQTQIIPQKSNCVRYSTIHVPIIKWLIPSNLQRPTHFPFYRRTRTLHN